MSSMMVIGVIGTFAILLVVILIVWFMRWLSYHRFNSMGARSSISVDIDHDRSLSLPTHILFSEPNDVYREELKDSFIEVALWHCHVCRFRNHPDRKMCDLCQTPRQEVTTRYTSSRRSSTSSSKMGRIGEGEPYEKELSSSRMSKLQLAASRRMQWKRMPTNDGLHRWVRQSSSSMSKRDSISSDRSSIRLSAATLRYIPEDRDSVASVGYIRVRDSAGRLVLNESDVVATDFNYRINIMDARGTSELIMNLERVHNLPFPDKLRWFSTEIHRLWLPWESGHVEMVVRRNHIVEDSFRVIHALKPFQLRQRWRVAFEGEPALDAGGVMREWFTLLFDELFDQRFGLFVSTVGDERSYWINTYSGEYRYDHLAYFQFAGRLLGKAILEEHLSTVHLALPFLKHILGVPISFSDLQFLDDEIYRSAVAVRESNDVEPLCLDFTVTRLGRDGNDPVTFELVPNGAHIDVTMTNKGPYLEALFKYYVMDSVSEQLLGFLTALYDVVPEGLLKLFDYQELELLMCGVPSLDVQDWMKHTDFRYFTEDVPTELELENTRWFWEVLGEMKNEDRARLLQFATGTSRVPAQGFKGLISSDGRIRQFNIAFTGENREMLFPKAHTCFNRLDLPAYSSKEEMAMYLKLIVEMDITGFSIE
ncbi:hypothetical protein Poli38472_008646 [Pythium oligandrum]|uniref:HECT-type E3 ubiquitin transferase n=1 Tax=Pythium oligandrum TaxID=41045 RepID=A0A8K1C3Y5_PYTOL|nr:hypothetical protein Poli38472_008646 [Pythium oligandrum]|eukprot:TMW55998.1 hypothetical protein Poli38472_008646 [Pythium oligandrum]